MAQLARSKGVAVLASCLRGETAKEVPDLEHGVFTYALLEGLGGATANAYGIVTPSGLKAYVEPRVYELTGQYFTSAQMPAGWLGGQDFPIGVVQEQRP